MSRVNIARHRLFSQHIAGTAFDTPSDLVRWLGAVQAQDYLGALWAVGLRVQNKTEVDVEQALFNRTIIRTWPLRGTLHFVWRRRFSAARPIGLLRPCPPQKPKREPRICCRVLMSTWLATEIVVL
jgi:hypothetical protein